MKWMSFEFRLPSDHTATVRLVSLSTLPFRQVRDAPSTGREKTFPRNVLRSLSILEARARSVSSPEPVERRLVDTQAVRTHQGLLRLSSASSSFMMFASLPPTLWSAMVIRCLQLDRANYPKAQRGASCFVSFRLRRVVCVSLLVPPVRP